MTSHICAEHVYVCPRMCRRICMPARPGRVSIHNIHIYLHTHTWAWASHACQYAQYRMQNMLGTQAEREREIEYIGHLWSGFGTLIICGIYIIFILNSLVFFFRFILICEWQILIICFYWQIFIMLLRVFACLETTLDFLYCCHKPGLLLYWRLQLGC